MARTPRPVNPDEGPVQAFAHELRGLREEAGNPTYRALAKTAGFSATTLGDAAGGVRLPTLEVALAYVGACGGDTDAWRIRWQEVNRQLAVMRPVVRGERGERSDSQGPGDAGGFAARDGDGGAAASAQSSDGAEAGAAGAAGAADAGSGSEPTAAAGAVAAKVTAAGAGDEADGPESPAIAAEVDAAGTAIEAVGPESQAVEPGQASARRRIRRRPVLAAAAAFLLAVGAAVWWSAMPDHPATSPTAAVPNLHPSASAFASASAPPAACPASSPAPGTFTGLTYEPNTKVRAGASTAAAIVAQVPAGCTLRFTGYCLGEVVESGYSGSPDMRWFELSGGGLVASAILHGDPPPAMAPSPCPGSVPPPHSVSLGVAPQAGGANAVTLQASGSMVWIIGFAAYYPGAPGETPQWHQLSMTDDGTPFFTATLKIDLSADATGATGIPVVADACLGGTATTPVFAAEQLDPADPAALQPVSLAPADLAAAESKACSYPTTT